MPVTGGGRGIAASMPARRTAAADGRGRLRCLSRTADYAENGQVVPSVAHQTLPGSARSSARWTGTGASFAVACAPSGTLAAVAPASAQSCPPPQTARVGSPTELARASGLVASIAVGQGAASAALARNRSRPPNDETARHSPDFAHTAFDRAADRPRRAGKTPGPIVPCVAGRARLDESAVTPQRPTRVAARARRHKIAQMPLRPRVSGGGARI